MHVICLNSKKGISTSNEINKAKAQDAVQVIWKATEYLRVGEAQKCLMKNTTHSNFLWIFFLFICTRSSEQICKSKYGSTESRAFMNDWLIDFLLFFSRPRIFHSNIESHHFRWRVGLKSILSIYSLIIDTLFQDLKLSGKSFLKYRDLPPTGLVAIIAWLSRKVLS